MKKISIGHLKHRLTLLHTHRNFDKFGGWVDIIQSGVKVWGLVEPIVTRDAYQQARNKDNLMTCPEHLQNISSLKYRILMRSDCPLKDITAVKWHQKTQDVFFKITCHPFLVLEDQFWCVLVIQQKREG